MKIELEVGDIFETSTEREYGMLLEDNRVFVVHDKKASEYYQSDLIFFTVDASDVSPFPVRADDLPKHILWIFDAVALVLGIETKGELS